MSLSWINHAILPDSIRLWPCQHLMRWSRTADGCFFIREAQASPGRMGLGLYILEVMAVRCVMWFCIPQGRMFSHKRGSHHLVTSGVREQLFLAYFPLSSCNTGPYVLDSAICIVYLVGCSLWAIYSQAFLRCQQGSGPITNIVIILEERI